MHGMALTQIGQDLAGGNGHRGEQIYRAEALVIVGHRPRPAERLTTGLLGADSW